MGAGVNLSCATWVLRDERRGSKRPHPPSKGSPTPTSPLQTTICYFVLKRRRRRLLLRKMKRPCPPCGKEMGEGLEVESVVVRLSCRRVPLSYLRALGGRRRGRQDAAVHQRPHHPPPPRQTGVPFRIRLERRQLKQGRMPPAPPPSQGRW